MDKSRERNKRWYKAATAVVREVIHHWDPYALLAEGSPPDEFDGEITAIVAQLPRIRGEQDAVHTISRVFASSFEPELFTVEHCQQVGECLFRRLTEESLVD